MYCPYCGKETPDSSLFCRHCGRATGGAPQADNIDSSPEQAKQDRRIPIWAWIAGALALVSLVLAMLLIFREPKTAYVEVTRVVEELVEETRIVEVTRVVTETVYETVYETIVEMVEETREVSDYIPNHGAVVVTRVVTETVSEEVEVPVEVEVTRVVEVEVTRVVRESTEEGTEVGSIWVLLPDSNSSPRWETSDRHFFEQLFEAAGVEYNIVNAEGDARTQQTQAEQAITAGAKVILLVNLDSGSAAAIIANAHDAGVKVIDYDRLTVEGPGADAYVGFQNEPATADIQEPLIEAEVIAATEIAIAFLEGEEITKLTDSRTLNNGTNDIPYVAVSTIGE